MVDKPTLKAGTIPGTNIPRNEPSEFDKFVSANIDKAVIGTPTGDHGVNPINKNNPTPVPAIILELPPNVTPVQAAQLQAAFAAIISGQNVTTTPNLNAPQVPPNNPNAIVPESHNRMWNPYQPFQATTRLSDMERSVAPGAVNPTSIIPGAAAVSPLRAKDGCSPVLIDVYNTLNNLIQGKWFKFGAPIQGIETTLERFKEVLES